MAAKQRRLAAIMFTDLVGYSAPTQENEALVQLDKALEIHDPWLCFMGVVPTFPMDDPRFDDVLRKIGL